MQREGMRMWTSVVGLFEETDSDTLYTVKSHNAGKVFQCWLEMIRRVLIMTYWLVLAHRAAWQCKRIAG